MKSMHSSGQTSDSDKGITYEPDLYELLKHGLKHAHSFPNTTYDKYKLALQLIVEKSSEQIVVNTWNKFTKENPLHRAISADHAGILLDILPKEEQIKAVKAKDKYNNTPVYFASSAQHAKLLLDKLTPKEQVEIVKDIELSVATSAQHAKLLLDKLTPEERTSAVKVKDYNNNIPLHKATSAQHAKLLLDVLTPEEQSKAVKSESKYRRTPVYYATSAQHAKLLLDILTPEEQVEIVKDISLSVTRTAQHAKLLLDILPKEDRISYSQKALANIIVNIGHGSNALYMKNASAAIRGILEYFPEEDRINLLTQGNWNAIKSANNPKAIDALLSPFSVKARNTIVNKPIHKDGDTILNTYIKNNHTAMVDKIISYGADPKIQEKSIRGSSSFHKVILAEHISIQNKQEYLTLLAKNDPSSIDTPDKHGSTPLRTLITDAKIDIFDAEKCKKEIEELANFMITVLGADPSKKDLFDNSITTLAKRKGITLQERTVAIKIPESETAVGSIKVSDVVVQGFPVEKELGGASKEEDVVVQGYPVEKQKTQQSLASIVGREDNTPARAVDRRKWAFTHNIRKRVEPKDVTRHSKTESSITR